MAHQIAGTDTNGHEIWYKKPNATNIKTKFIYQIRLHGYPNSIAKVNINNCIYFKEFSEPSDWLELTSLFIIEQPSKQDLKESPATQYEIRSTSWPNKVTNYGSLSPYSVYEKENAFFGVTKDSLLTNSLFIHFTQGPGLTNCWNKRIVSTNIPEFNYTNLKCDLPCEGSEPEKSDIKFALQFIPYLRDLNAGLYEIKFDDSELKRQLATKKVNGDYYLIKIPNTGSVNVTRKVKLPINELVDSWEFVLQNPLPNNTKVYVSEERIRKFFKATDKNFPNPIFPIPEELKLSFVAQILDIQPGYEAIIESTSNAIQNAEIPFNGNLNLFADAHGVNWGAIEPNSSPSTLILDYLQKMNIPIGKTSFSPEGTSFNMEVNGIFKIKYFIVDFTSKVTYQKLTI